MWFDDSMAAQARQFGPCHPGVSAAAAVAMAENDDEFERDMVRMRLRRQHEQLDAAARAAGGYDFSPFNPVSPPRRVSSAAATTTTAAPMAARASPPRDPLAGLVDQLRARLPVLSAGFTCSGEDALVILTAVESAAVARAGGAVGALPGEIEDRLVALDAKKRTAEAQLDRCRDEIDRLKDELGDARGKLRAVQQQARHSADLLSQKRDEVRKQLLLEEGRTAKLAHQNRLLTAEVDKLKERLRTSLR